MMGKETVDTNSSSEDGGKHSTPTVLSQLPAKSGDDIKLVATASGQSTQKGNDHVHCDCQWNHLGFSTYTGTTSISLHWNHFSVSTLLCRLMKWPGV